MTQTDNLDAPAGQSDREPAQQTTSKPADDLLARVEATVAAIADKLSPVPQLERSLRRWRVSFFLLGAICTAVLGLGLHVALPVVKGADAVATLTPAGAEPGFLVALSADGHDVIVRRLVGPPEAGKAHTLWLLPDGGQPVMAGRLGADPSTRLARPPHLNADASGKVGFAISLEPDGATPAGPGRQLYAGRLVSVLP